MRYMYNVVKRYVSIYLTSHPVTQRAHVGRSLGRPYPLKLIQLHPSAICPVPAEERGLSI